MKAGGNACTVDSHNQLGGLALISLLWVGHPGMINASVLSLPCDFLVTETRRDLPYHAEWEPGKPFWVLGLCSEILRPGRNPMQHIRAGWGLEFGAIHRSRVYGVLTEHIITCGGQGYTVTLLLPRNVIPHLSRKANTIRACASPSLDQTARNKVRESDSSSASSVPKLSQAGTRLPKLRGFNIVAEA